MHAVSWTTYTSVLHPTEPETNYLIGSITALNRTFPLATLSYALLISSKGNISVITLTLPLAA
jgi:hypothetical protein